MLGTESEEVWKIIPDTDGIYWASSLGRVKSVITYVNKGGKGRGKGKPWQLENIMKGLVNKDGYIKVSMYIDKKRVFRVAHRLIAQAFIPNPMNFKIVHHKNNIRDDNRPENLEWCDIKYNSQLENRSHTKFDLKGYIRKHIIDNSITTLDELLNSL